ncbi:MAG TPA: hypothetical protein VK196_07185 [Magnetospirillum sp.]|nr:hypothetical protein [Magnetospirillum sp.]
MRAVLTVVLSLMILVPGSAVIAAEPQSAREEAERLRADMEGQAERLRLTMESFMAQQDRRIGDALAEHDRRVDRLRRIILALSGLSAVLALAVLGLALALRRSRRHRPRPVTPPARRRGTR